MCGCVSLVVWEPRKGFTSEDMGENVLFSLNLRYYLIECLLLETSISYLISLIKANTSVGAQELWWVLVFYVRGPCVLYSYCTSVNSQLSEGEAGPTASAEFIWKMV